MNYGPNSDGVLWFYNAVLPLIRRQTPDLQFWVVGSNPPPAIAELNEDPNVMVTGFVEDVRPYLADGAVIVVPLRLGSGTRLKILDAWAMEKAIVSTRLGAEGLQATHGEDILLADEPDRFAECVLSLLVDGEKRSRLGKAGRRLAESTYGWSAIAPKLDQVYESLQDGHTAWSRAA
jgi:glycosyltransferase involved in cell wall biosynthesis